MPAVGWTRADGVRKVCAVWPVEDDEGDNEGDDEGDDEEDDEEEVEEGEGEGDGEVDPSGQCPSG